METKLQLLQHNCFTLATCRDEMLLLAILFKDLTVTNHLIEWQAI